MPGFDGGGEGGPDLEIAGVFLEHAFGMELKSYYEGGFGIVVGLDQAVVGVRHRLEALGQLANSLVMIAVDLERFAAIPA